MSKRVISLFASFVLVLACIMPANFVLADDENLVFELDLSSSTVDSVVAANKVSGGNSTVTVNGSPGVGQINDNKFVTFSSNAAIKVQDSDFINQDEMTFELWMKGYNFGAADTGSYRMAIMATGGGEDNFRYDIYGYNNSIFYRPGGPKASASTNAPDTRYNSKFADYDEKWCHFVFTRKWTPTAGAAEGTGRWSGELYVNGVKIGPNYTNDNNDQLRRDETDLYLVIGNNGYYSSPFAGEIATFKVYNSILGGSSILEKYEAEKRNFISYADTLEVEGISATGGIISDAAGEMTITFNNYIDIDTVSKGIFITKADGGNVTGGAYASAKSDFTNQAVVRYGRLDTGADYILNITPELKSINNKSYSGQTAFTYTAGKEYMYYEDFTGDEYVVDSTPPDDAVLKYTSANEDGNSSNIKVRSEGGVKYISMTGGGQIEKNSRIRLSFDTPITEDVFIADIKLRPAAEDDATNSNTPRNVMTVAGANASVQLASMRSGYVEANTSPGANATISGDVNFVKTDSNGFYDLQVIFERDADGNYVMTLQNANDLSEGKAVYRSKNIQDVKSIEISHLYPLNLAQATTASADVARIAIYKVTAPSILHTDFETISRSEDTFNIIFNDDMDDTTMDESTFCVVAPDGNNVYTEYLGYDEENRTVSVRLKDYLDSATDYKLRVGNISSKSGLIMNGGEYIYKTAEGQIGATDIEVTNQTGAEITSLDDATQLVCDITIKNNKADAAVCTMYAMLYDANGRMTSLLKNDGDGVVSAMSENTLTVTVEELTGVEKVKILAWAETDSGAISVVKPVVLTKNN